jgi:NADPH-dependent ferric siderophore reductase
MTDKEAMKQALEALEKLWLLGDQAGTIANPAIAALKEQLAQPAQRTWVGLTDEEQQQAYEQWQNDGWGVFYNAIEAKLKQKNGYAEEKNT